MLTASRWYTSYRLDAVKCISCLTGAGCVVVNHRHGCVPAVHDIASSTVQRPGLNTAAEARSEQNDLVNRGIFHMNKQFSSGHRAVCSLCVAVPSAFAGFKHITSHYLDDTCMTTGIAKMEKPFPSKQFAQSRNQAVTNSLRLYYLLKLMKAQNLRIFVFHF